MKLPHDLARPMGVCCRLTLLALACGMPAWVGADPLGDQLKKEALLRGYTTAEAERRYEAYQREPQAHINALNKGLGNLVNNLYQRQAAKAAATQQLWDEMWEAIRRGQDYPIQSAAEGAELRRMLDVQATRNDGGEVLARRRLVEYALHVRPGSEHLFPQLDAGYAAAQLRGPAYENDPWSANLLAKLYLLGLGVPKDEGEALRLVTRFGNRLGVVKSAMDDDARCALTRVRLLEEGWGTQQDTQAAAKYLEATLNRYSAHAHLPGLTRDALERRLGR